MARKARGMEQLEIALARLKKAKTVAELRSAQAIVLPLALGLSLEQASLAIGRSVGSPAEYAPGMIQRWERKKNHAQKV